MSGTADKAKGKAKQALGDLTDDESLHKEGKLDEAAGKAKDAAQDAIDTVKEKVDKHT